MALAESRPRSRRRPELPGERKLFREGFLRVAGVDEAGRGPLAGPVVAAAVVLDPKRIPKGIADSKVLTPNAARGDFRRAAARPPRSPSPSARSTAIDRINILQATLVAMRRAVRGLAAPPDAVLDRRQRSCRQAAVRGARRSSTATRLSLSIAAASIVAKVMRDRLMTRCDATFAGYGLASHKGYSTKEHQEALTALGPCRLHRRSFWRVAAFYRRSDRAAARRSGRDTGDVRATLRPRIDAAAKC